LRKVIINILVLTVGLLVSNLYGQSGDPSLVNDGTQINAMSSAKSWGAGTGVLVLWLALFGYTFFHGIKMMFVGSPENLKAVIGRIFGGLIVCTILELWING
jgi:hypothetical protein